MLLLMPFCPPPVNCEGEGGNLGVNDLKVVKAGLCNVNALISGALNCRLTVQGDSDLTSSDVVKAAENVKEAQSAQDSREFTPM